jgi:hypothetical protein
MSGQCIHALAIRGSGVSSSGGLTLEVLSHVELGLSHATIQKSPVSDLDPEPYALTSCCPDSGDLTRWLCSHFLVFE